MTASLVCGIAADAASASIWLRYVAMSVLSLSVITLMGASFVAALLDKSWLHKLPYEFDFLRYCETINRDYGRTATISVRVDFVQTVPPPQRRLVADALLAHLKHGSTSWDYDTLVITSPELTACSMYRGEVSSNNTQLHSWFRELPKKALPPIHAAHPVRSLEVSIDS